MGMKTVLISKATQRVNVLMQPAQCLAQSKTLVNARYDDDHM